MANVSAPYNFVPLNKNVFFPPWAELVSHDVPFQEGLSGKIKLKITAETPIFIRKPYEKGDEAGSYYTNDKGDKISKEFCHIKDVNGKKYYIPGSSLKGEIRNVLEIMSFSKLNIFNNVKYSQREFNNTELYDKRKFANVKGGWVSKQGDEYIIEYSTEKPGRISFDELQNILSIDFNNIFGNNFNERDDNNKTAQYKYNLVSNLPLSYKFTYLETRDGRKLYKRDSSGKPGTIVFTGQASGRKQKKDKRTKELIFNVDGSPKMIGKWLEFIFWKPNKKEELNEDDIRIKNFKMAYHDGDPGNESPDWKYFKQKLNNGEKIPVFITVKDGEIEHFGLSMLYKLPYQRSVGEILGKEHLKIDKDLAETIFGYINEKNKDDTKLKGRVSVKHAFATKVVVHPDEYTTVLASPKPTYYPYYIEQDLNKYNVLKTPNYSTYNDGTIAGRKLYPVRDKINIISLSPSTITTTFKPLDKGAEFETEIVFHNLLPEELGALLSAITFHGNSGKYRHNIGMAKPYGFGSVRIELKELKTDKEYTKENMDDLMCAFEKLMDKELKDNWLQTEQIKELLALKYPIKITQENKSWFKYLELSIEDRKNEFEDLKREKKGLPKYSAFMNMNEDIMTINSLCNDDNISLTDPKKAIREKLARKLSEIESKKQEIQRENLIEAGICGKLKDFNGKYGDLKSIIDLYVIKANISGKGAYFTDEKQVECVMKALHTAIKNLKGKKKKLFYIDEKKKNTIKQWIGEEKTNEIFNNKN